VIAYVRQARRLGMTRQDIVGAVIDVLDRPADMTRP
jgi:hypothetical protein